jgi:hypothetical protein
MIIWGAEDHALDRRVAEESLAQCDRGRLEIIDEARSCGQQIGVVG